MKNWSNARHVFGAAAILSFGLAACSPSDVAQDSEPVTAAPATEQAIAEQATDERAYFEQLLSSPFQGTGSASDTPVDFEAAFEDLPEGVSIETGAVSTVDQSGATRVEDFAIIYDLDGTGVGIQADEVLFYGFDPDAVPDRIRGTNLDASVKVADRIELRGVKSIGMDAVSKMFVDQYVDAIDDLAGIDDEIVADLNALDVFTYNFQMETLLLDGFVLEPFVYAKMEDDVEGLSEGPDGDERFALQMVGAFMRAFSMDALAYRDVTVDYQIRDSDIEMSMDMTLGLAGLRDYNRGDLAYSGSWDTVFSGAMPMPADPIEETAMRMVPMTGGVEFSAMSGMRLSRAFEALANWELPSKDETDFLSLGVWELTNYTMDMADKSLFKAERISFDSDFHWLLPTKFDLALVDTGYNVGNLVQVMTQELGEEIAPGFGPEQLAKGLAIAEQYGFDCLCGDYALALAWDEGTGDVTYKETSRFADAFNGRNTADLGFVTPAIIAGLVDADDAEAQFEQAAKEAFEFRSLEVTMTDTGGLTNLFEMLHAIGEAFPEQEGMAILAYNDAAQLRSLAVNSVIGMKPMIRQQAPMADPWMDAVASFLEEGGTLTLAAQPALPINAELIESLDAEGFEPEPEELVEIFGLTVTHTK
ncbi:MAG: hypothetical protein ABJH52_11800 [Henriciella sp.]